MTSRHHNNDTKDAAVLDADNVHNNVHDNDLTLDGQATQLLHQVQALGCRLGDEAAEAAAEATQARRNARAAHAVVRKYGLRVATVFHNHRHATAASAARAPLPSPRPPATPQARLLETGLALERCQRALATAEARTAAHDEAAAAAWGAAQTAWTHERTALCEAHERATEAAGRELDERQAYLVTTQARLQAAEEDATTALSLARANAAAREEVEGWYTACLARNDVWEERLLQQPQGHDDGAGDLDYSSSSRHSERSSVDKRVHFADGDETTNGEAAPAHDGPPPNATMVAMGRRLLAESRGDDALLTTVSSASPREIAARRRQWTERLVGAWESPTSGPPQPPIGDRKTGKLLQESGRRLQLPGRWWHTTTTTKPLSPTDAESPSVTKPHHEATESLARHYCQAVEVSFLGW
jgi:hypothetical protein